MIYTDLTILAMKTAYIAHHGQQDKSGVPYIFHPIHLAEQMTTEDTCVVALLHDVVEDTDTTIEDLRILGFTEAQLEAIELLTHVGISKDKLKTATREEKEADYFAYVEQIKTNPIARAVKLADLAHNSDITRLKEPTLADELRYEKYQKARMILEESE